MQDNKLNWDWEGKHLAIKVLYSVGGVSTSILVFLKKENYFSLLDVGDGTLREIISCPQQDIFFNLRYIFISHGHFDHIGGIFSLLCFLRMIRHRNKIVIFSPPNIPELEGIIELYEKLYSDTTTFLLEHKKTYNPIEIGELKVKPFQTKHRSSLKGKMLEPINAVGYILSYNGEKVVYTGDTGYFHHLEEIIRNADFALIEATYDTKKTEYHLTYEEAKGIGKLAKRYKIIHRSEFLFNR